MNREKVSKRPFLAMLSFFLVYDEVPLDKHNSKHNYTTVLATKGGLQEFRNEYQEGGPHGHTYNSETERDRKKVYCDSKTNKGIIISELRTSQNFGKPFLPHGLLVIMVLLLLLCRRKPGGPSCRLRGGHFASCVRLFTGLLLLHRRHLL